MKNHCRFLSVVVILAACLCNTGCAVTLSGLVAGAAQVVSPVARSIEGGDGEQINTAGLRVGDFAVGGFVGRVPNRVTPAATTERRVQAIEAAMNELETQLALERAPDK